MTATKPKLIRLLVLFLAAAVLALGFNATPAVLAQGSAPAGVGIIHSDGTVTEADERGDEAPGLFELDDANAYTDSSGGTRCFFYGIMLYCYYWRDYNWYEEVFQGKRDGYVVKWTGRVK